MANKPRWDIQLPDNYKAPSVPRDKTEFKSVREIILEGSWDQSTEAMAKRIALQECMLSIERLIESQNEISSLVRQIELRLQYLERTSAGQS